MNNHEIDYTIFGEEMQYVEVELDPQESVIAEPGAFMMMQDDISMQTLFGDGSNQQNGLLGKLFNAGKRLLVGENLFMTAFTNQGAQKRTVSFASPYPGKIVPIDLSQLGGNQLAESRLLVRVGCFETPGVARDDHSMKSYIAYIRRAAQFSTVQVARGLLFA